MKYCFRIHDWHLFLSVFWSFYYHSGFPCCWGINCLCNCNFSWQSIAGGVSASFKKSLLYFLMIYGFTIVYLSINLFLCFSYLGFLSLPDMWIYVSWSFWKILAIAILYTVSPCSWFYPLVGILGWYEYVLHLQIWCCCCLSLLIVLYFSSWFVTF